MKAFASALGAWLLALSLVPAARAAFELEPAGARPAALSGAFTAVGDDVHALYYNPGGLYQLGRPELSMQYAKLLNGLSDGSSLGFGMLAFGQPVKGWGGALALGYTRFNLSDLYSEQTLTAGYGRSFDNERWGLGLAVKQLKVSYGADIYSSNALNNNAQAQVGVVDPVLAGKRSASALALDAGVLFHALPTLDLGASVLNLNQPDVGLAETVRVPRTLRAGAALWALKGRFSLDLIRRSSLEDQADTTLAAGYEFRQTRAGRDVLLRGGALSGSRGRRQLTAGVGYRSDGLQLDYAFTLPVSGLQTANFSHRFSVTLRFEWESLFDAVTGRSPRPRAQSYPAVLPVEPAPAPAAIEPAPAPAPAPAAVIEVSSAPAPAPAEPSTAPELSSAAVPAPAPAPAEPSAAPELSSAAAPAPAPAEPSAAPEVSSAAAPAPAPRPVPAPATETAVSSAPALPSLSEEPEPAPARVRALKAEFASALARYRARVAGGLEAADQAAELSALIERYRDSGEDLSGLRKELSATTSLLLKERAKLKEVFERDWARYERAKARGALVTEMLELLDKMQQRYDGMGLDLKRIELERKLLRERRPK